MKKILKIVVPLVLVCSAVWFGYNYYFGGKAYYTKIETVDKKSTGIGNNGKQQKQFTYSQTAFDDNGNQTEQKLHEFRDSPLRMDTFLKLKVNARKGVLSWEEVTEKEVPEKAFDKINQK